MAKYNIREKKEKPAAYRAAIKPELIDAIYEQLLRKMIVEKKYKDPTYSAKRLAEEIHTNTRYISAAVSLRFQQNFSELINGYRVREAISMLTDKRNRSITIGDVAKACGFANRQSFYSAFYRQHGKTPKQYRDEFLAKVGQPKQKARKKE